MSAGATPSSIRAYEPGDAHAVVDLIEADRLPGQPRITAAMLSDALVGRSTVDSSWWSALSPPVTEVFQSDAAEISGVVSYAIRPSDNVGVILWLHGREHPQVVQALLERALSELGDRAVHAFDFASALSLGLEGLPVRYRPVTHKALIAAGFTREDLWRCLRADLPLEDLPIAEGVEVRPAADSDGTQLEIRRDGQVIAEATISAPVDGIGVLWWISVNPAARGHGLGPALLGSAFKLLASRGADQVILYVDDDAPAGDLERDRTAANRMYDHAGLQEIDRLFSYRRDLTT